MTGTAEPLSATHRRLHFERRWDRISQPLPTWTLFRENTHRRPFDYTRALTRLCADIARRSPAFQHLDLNRMLLTLTPSRNPNRFGLQARVTPLRFRNGALTHRYGDKLFGVQRYYVDGREILYLVTFCMPRFLNQSFQEKWITLFHELYHLSPTFNGDFRRLEGRCEMHSNSKREYDRQMVRLIEEYRQTGPDESLYEFLHLRGADFASEGCGLQGVMVPRPRLVPLHTH